MPSAADARAVVIDGTPLMRMGMSTALLRAGVPRVVEFEDGDRAMASMWANPPDLVMTGGIGSEAVELMRRFEDLDRRPPIIAILSTLGPEDLRQLLELGLQSLLPVHVSPDDLVDAIIRVLRGERVMSEAVVPLLFGSEAKHVPLRAEVLSAKERSVMHLLAEGRTTGDIAAQLCVSVATVKTHLSHIYVKLGARNRHEAVIRAVELGLVW